MPNTFKNARKLLQTTVGTAVYTCPSATIAVVIGCQVANTSTTTDEEVTVQYTDASAANAITRLVSSVIVPAKASLAPIAGKLVLEAGDTLGGIGQVNNRAEMTVSVLEISWVPTSTTAALLAKERSVTRVSGVLVTVAWRIKSSLLSLTFSSSQAVVVVATLTVSALAAVVAAVQAVIERHLAHLEAALPLRANCRLLVGWVSRWLWGLVVQVGLEAVLHLLVRRQSSVLLHLRAVVVVDQTTATQVAMVVLAAAAVGRSTVAPAHLDREVMAAVGQLTQPVVVVVLLRLERMRLQTRAVLEAQDKRPPSPLPLS